MTTASTIIQDAMIEMGALDPSDPAPTNNELAYGLRLLNYMLSDWSNRRIMVYVNTQYSKSLTVGTGEYTIGTGGDIDSTRPVAIEGAFIRDSGGNDYPMSPVTEDEYRSVTDKDTSGMPDNYLFRGDYPLAKVILWPVPDDSSDTLYIDCIVPLTSISDLNTSISFPPGYEEAIRTGLALRLCPSYNKIPSEVTISAAANALSAIVTSNIRNRGERVALPDMPGVSPGFYDIFSDSYNYQ